MGQKVWKMMRNALEQHFSAAQNAVSDRLVVDWNFQRAGLMCYNVD